MLACHCLNVIIETEENDFQKVNPEILSLSKQGLDDSFFKQELQQITKLININKTHSGLIQTRNVDLWAVHYCMNCDVHTHAIHREKGASCVLVNSKLLSREAIAKLKTSDKFSSLYNIVVNTDDYTEDDILSHTYYPSEVESVIKSLKIIASDVLKTETSAVEQRIKEFAEEQYNKLSYLKEKAFREQKLLTKIILKNTVKSAKPGSTNLNISPNTQELPSRMNEDLAAGRDITSNPNNLRPLLRHTPKRQKSLPNNSSHHMKNFERLFEFDGIDDIQSEEDSEAIESDLDDTNEGGIRIRQSASNTEALSMAKSLPMTIPGFLPQSFQNQRNLDDFDDNKDLDIAASIKALAKSVHGDTVFGDLPKPRCPSYI